MTQHASLDQPRRRGRPPGSKNRPKPPPRGNDDAAPVLGVVAPSAGSSTPATSAILDGHQATAERLQAALATEKDPKVIASLSSTLNRTLWHIGKLTGEGDITESQIVRSKAWRSFLAKLEPILERHPECAAELHAFLESVT